MSQRTVTMLAWMVIALYCALIANTIGKPGNIMFDDHGRPAVVDYVAMWTAGNLTLEGRPEVTYNRSAHKAAQDRDLGFDTAQAFPWAYPPPYFALVALFSTLPYLASFAAFTLASVALFALVNARIIGQPEGGLWMLATAATYWCVTVGQNGNLNAALLGAGLLLIPNRPLLAGVCIGLLSYKPHLGLLLPVALAAAGLWRTFAAAAATTLALALASLPLFGLAAWTAFLAAMSEFGTLVLLDDYARPYRLQSLFGLLRSAGVSPPAAFWTQIAWTLVPAAAVVVLWRRPYPYALKAAGLATAAVMASPYLFIYDLPVLTIAQAFLIRHMLATGVTLPRVAPLIAANLLIMAFPLMKLPTGFLAAVLTSATIALEPGAFAALLVPRTGGNLRPTPGTAP